MKKTPVYCPSCSGELAVVRLVCRACGTEVSGEYRLPPVLRLSPEDQAFAEAFIVESGSLKAMARRLGVSYPTVRNRLDEIIELLEQEDA